MSYSNKKVRMGMCVMICGSNHSSAQEHEKVYIQACQSAKIEEEVKADPQAPVVTVEEVPSKQEIMEKSRINQRNNLRRLRKSRFFWQKNLQESNLSHDQPTQPQRLGTVIMPECTLRHRTSKKQKKKYLQEFNWVDESKQKSSSSKRRDQNNSLYSRQSLTDILSHKFICIRQSKELLLSEFAATEKDKQLIQSISNEVVPKELNEVVEYADGSTYCGQWMKGMRHGKGIYMWKDGSKYEGEWHANNMEGNGILTFCDGEYYAGLFKDNQAFGQGQYRSNDGSVYNGGWFDSQQEGEGSEVFRNGEKYNGMWSKGKKNGFGQLQFEDGSYYRGEFVNNQLQGQGEYSWKGQKTYKGQWLHNEKWGKGCMIWANGERYQGYFQHDKMHGAGRFSDKNDFIFQGNWQQGRRQGVMTQIRPNGQIMTGVWCFNKFLHYVQPKSPERTQNSSNCSIQVSS